MIKVTKLLCFILSFAFLLTFNFKDALASCLDSKDFRGRVCWYNVRHSSMQYEPIPVKIFIPEDYDDKTEVFLFLHGKGYSRRFGAKIDTMFEDIEGLKWMSKRQKAGLSVPIVVAPHDNFEHEVAGVMKRGRDYWIGNESRDWRGFLSEGLMSFLASELKHSYRPEVKAIGVSMGAHGALDLLDNFPEVFSAAAALSPVFRATEGRLKEVQSFKLDYKNSIGFRAIKARSGDECLFAPMSNIYLRTHADDFGYRRVKPSDPLEKAKFLRGYEPNQSIFDQFSRCLKSSNSELMVDYYDLGESSGHSAKYWRRSLPEALNWLVNVRSQKSLDL